MKHAATLELYAYWNSLRGERAAPERANIDPAAIRGILADTFILEVDAARRFPFRLCGTRIEALFTRELKACSFPWLWARADRLDIVDILCTVCDDATPVVGGVQAAPNSREPIDLELLLLPLRHLGRTHARVLGCLSPAALPGWIGLLPPEHLSLRGHRVLPTPVNRGAAPAPGARVCASVPPCAIDRKGSRRGHLFVYEGGR